MASLPLLFARPNWYTSRFIAARLGVSHRTVQYWCETGLLLRRGYIIATTTDREGRRYWVHIPLSLKDAMLRKVPYEWNKSPTASELISV